MHKHWNIFMILLLTSALLFSATEEAASLTSGGDVSFYDKGFLNDPIMQLDMDSLKTALDQHVYKVREGSIGGFDSAGGACGCN